MLAINNTNIWTSGVIRTVMSLKTRLHNISNWKRYKYLSYGVSLGFPGWTGTSYVNQAGLKLTVISPSLIPHDWFKGVCHHTWLQFFSIFFFRQLLESRKTWLYTGPFCLCTRATQTVLTLHSLVLQPDNTREQRSWPVAEAWRMEKEKEV